MIDRPLPCHCQQRPGYSHRVLSHWYYLKGKVTIYMVLDHTTKECEKLWVKLWVDLRVLWDKGGKLGAHLVILGKHGVS